MSKKLTESILHDRWMQSGSVFDFPEWVKIYYPYSYSEFFKLDTKEEQVGCGVTGDKSDMVNRPPHYTQHPSGVECIQITEHMSFTIGNAMKYLWRADLKNGIEDLEKAKWYIEREIARRKREQQ